ncbi:DUF3300 domain-containing protein [Pseudidiomarina terrestris]|uniref:DUF3300 domain-containing protein n=1 Tax=Pseudidiomarina terrestris TaxID=2820060 RepID=A0AAW7QZU8_9GAMM|nr:MULTISPECIES: DUF3300 domain-containing protein [unclassified Pseudidiomarina]MDN7124992.1 DUF3300 domain-containing protein [Pseudidiomarina sp. 1APP75-32.1]MDN7129533.1 DUF3300 domain-containing protein [Pseudidiomarina sp. 1APR75-15]MDN7135847.1 DUF3300 domain-containing protein [Pseudidiomarina sp. 1ASP75-5]MDN7138212.1 DUF3300 domain-containing protein [Pseudidiomarina sp. 1ASP75-14]MEA3588013.1 DUF3300 domain-containing protein [Pseudidiomarina sp. 1APP75-27a]
MFKFNPAKLPLLKFSVLSIALATSVGCTAISTAHAESQSYSVSTTNGVYTQADLDRMLAPVALYPDSLLSHILIAATYPLEVVQAERWVSRHDHLAPEQALARADEENWDPSVKALVATPDVLKQMSENLEWTQALGEAFIAQQEEVLASIQVLRDRAYIAGNLRSDEHVSVAREARTIRIETVRREYIYVPVYDTRYVYGPWWHRTPPVYWGRPGVTFRVGSGVHWSLSYHVPHWYFFSDFYWPSRYVVVHHHHYHERERNHRRDDRYRPRPGDGDRWRHDPRHRRNVEYRHAELVENPPLRHHKEEPGRVVGTPVKDKRPPQVEVRRRLLEAEAQPRMRRIEERGPIAKQPGRVEQKPSEPVMRQQPIFERKANQPVVRQQPRFEPKPSQPVVRQQPRFEPKPSQPVVRQQPRFEPKPSQPVVRQQPRFEPKPRPEPKPMRQPVEVKDGKSRKHID